ncbi:MAG: O-acetylhomoserine aminocarboxypropyltransferase/cysteine synthase [Lachnospiraceae bacterium]|uniref:homocysteine desulfhydrase n=1 Tax=Candidatus Weimeria bifida TaxID=2599074 RepID=A0A6N7J1J2_9FIRM|nr:O-acetylhomoserine aminocarboxypropyltransferase/cysteine synthase [Candidatus Weimeria bifida]RRF96511.1 MAG: O-acetylhomoserine aminocarboxypropyltransferase/cysteine synthase [Lachnospiraceae bacterium]
MEFNTKLLHGKTVTDYPYGATVPPISQVTAFKFDTAEEQEKVFHHKAAGFAYSRVGNPTVAAFEQRMNELEGGNAAIACSSGMSAITLALLNMLCAGDEIIAGSGLYGGSIDLFEDLTKLGIKTRYVRHVNVEEIEPLINEHTRLIYGEVIGNPGLDVMDIKAVADLAHSHGLPLMTDSTTATPYIINPLKLGANIVVHSSSKYINGGGNSISGVIVDGAGFDWDFDKFKALDGYRKFGPLAYTIRLRTDIWENLGSCLSPFNAFMNIIGMETLGLRMERICSNASKLATALDQIPGIRVNYLTLPGNPYKGLVDRQFGGKGGGILTFRAGSKEKAFKILNNLQYVTKASNIGDLRTLAIHPASTLYIRSSEEQMAAAGVFDDTIRVSTGIEDATDLIEDFTRAIELADK